MTCQFCGREMEQTALRKSPDHGAICADPEACAAARQAAWRESQIQHKAGVGIPKTKTVAADPPAEPQPQEKTELGRFTPPVRSRGKFVPNVPASDRRFTAKAS